MRDRVATILATITAAVHLAVANRYDLFRDELYFIVCGRHPAFGYADQPPLVPFLAAGLYALGEQTWVLRLCGVFASAALVWVAVKFARLLAGTVGGLGSSGDSGDAGSSGDDGGAGSRGASDGAAWIAGVACAIAPMFLGLTATLNTTTFELLAWTLVCCLIARFVVLDDRRAPLWAGAVAGVAMEMKYALPLWLIALAVGLLCFPERRVLARRELWLGIGLAILIALPSVLWQAANGWPFVELVRNAGQKNDAVAPLAFAVNQVVVLNPLLAPVWLAGIVAPFAMRGLRVARFVPVAYAVTALAIVAGHGKDYYLAPAYPSLFAVGAVAWGRLVRSGAARTAYLALATALSAIIAPLALPILSPADLIAYQQKLHLVPQQQETVDQGVLLPSTFADMLGWHDFVREVAAAYASLPPAERATTSILVGNYGDAAALDVYGAPYGLPPALSGQNQYSLWRLRGQTPDNVLAVFRDSTVIAPHCTSVTRLGTTQSSYARSFENGKPIVFCRKLRRPLDALWSNFSYFL